jgi:hypothetical protein
MVDSAWRKIPIRFPAARLDGYIAMPNHLHRVIPIDVGRVWWPPATMRNPHAGRGDKPRPYGKRLRY